jgi:hypothetical protein
MLQAGEREIDPHDVGQGCSISWQYDAIWAFTTDIGIAIRLMDLI